MEFHQTELGRRYYEYYVPSIANSLKKIAELLEKQQEIAIKEKKVQNIANIKESLNKEKNDKK